MQAIKLGSAAQIPFYMVLSSDHVTPATGLSPVVQISKDGAAFAAPTGSVSEIGSGWYQLAAVAGDTGTAGPLILIAAVMTADQGNVVAQVVAYDPEDAVRLGLTALPNAAAASANGLLTSGGAAHQLTTQSGAVLISVGLDVGQLDVTEGIINANIVQVVGSAVETTGGQLHTRTVAMANNVIAAAAIAADVVADLFSTTALTEAYAADGATMTPAQLLYAIYSAVAQFSISGTTLTTKALDGTTTALTFTLDSATNPTSRVRS